MAYFSSLPPPGYLRTVKASALRVGAGTPQLLGEQHASPPRVARRGARRDPARQLQPAVGTPETRQKQFAMQCAREYGAIHADGVVHWQERPHAPGWWVARHCGSVCVFVSSRSVLERCANFERDHRGGGAERRACRDAFEDPANRDPGFRSCPADVARRPKVVCLAMPCTLKQSDLPRIQICVNIKLATSWLQQVCDGDGSANGIGVAFVEEVEHSIRGLLGAVGGSARAAHFGILGCAQGLQPGGRPLCCSADGACFGDM